MVTRASEKTCTIDVATNCLILWGFELGIRIAFSLAFLERNGITTALTRDWVGSKGGFLPVDLFSYIVPPRGVRDFVIFLVFFSYFRA